MAENSSKVTLPGSLYQKNNRWWWKVKLPGETRTKACGLKPRGARFATTDRAEAEELALGMWESAIRTEVQAAARAKARDKAKAVSKEIAEVKAEAAETVARLKAGIMDTVAKAKVELEERLRMCNESVSQVQEQLQAASAAVVEAEERVAGETAARIEAEERLAAEIEARTTAEQLAAEQSRLRAEAEVKLEERLNAPARMGTCDCCGRDDIPQEELSGIDSGQLLCPDCLSALRG
ncbi:MAG: hypothetical protein JW720_05340 [Sedimentisphaerales bacterium]|nr:hypothetical protein [Sedimentisphaerales bacterium]